MDVSGYYSAAAGATFTPLATARVFDGTATTTPTQVQITGLGGVPTTATAVVVNTEVFAPTAAGYVRVTPAGLAPAVASQEFAKGQAISNLVVVQLVGGKVQVNVSAGSARILMDVSGYYGAAAPVAPGPVTSLTGTPASTSIALSWTNPTDASMTGVMIRRATGPTAPTSATAGTLVVDAATPAATFTDTALTPGTQYSYALFTHDGTPLYSTATNLTTTTTSAADSQVVPINWGFFNHGKATGPNSVRMGTILNNTNRYALKTWYAAKGFSSPAQSAAIYLSLGGNLEANIRPVASEAQALAVSLKTGDYDPIATGVDLHSAVTKEAKLIRSLARSHRANTAGGWGGQWQSALWAAYAGQAGWLMWDSPYLTNLDRQNITQMIQYEANLLVGYAVPYYRNQAGTIISPGDTKAEENGWNAMILELATAMIPNDAKYDAWMYKEQELMVSSYALPSDVQSSVIVNGRSVADWLYGSNANQDGTVVNHSIIHPDYMSTISEDSFAALTSSLAHKSTPTAAFFNSSQVYASLTDLPFTAGALTADGGTIFAPGGTIYIPGSSNIYYPQGDDWGTARRMQFALVDAQADAFGFDTLSTGKGTYWESYHAQAVLDMQNLNADRRTYATVAEDTYSGREEWVAAYAAQAYLTKWLIQQQAFSQTSQVTPIVVDVLDREFTTPGVAWTVSTPVGRLGPTNRYMAAGSGVATARFTPRITVAGSYKVYAWWSAYVNHATNTPFVVQSELGSSTVVEDQRINGGQWNLLGTYTFDAGTSGYIELNNAANGYVVADGIKIVQG
jgi:hypothetical protein